MVDAGELDGGLFYCFVVGQGAGEALDGAVEIEELGALFVAADHAL